MTIKVSYKEVLALKKKSKRKYDDIITIHKKYGDQ